MLSALFRCARAVQPPDTARTRENRRASLAKPREVACLPLATPRHRLHNLLSRSFRAPPRLLSESLVRAVRD